MIFISYATLETPYEEVIKSHLIPSLKKFGLSYEIAYVKDQGSWQKNTALKSKIIKQMLLKYKEAVCFLDSDAVIEKKPDLLLSIPKNIDIAYHEFNWYGHWRGQWDNTTKMELLSGTMVFNYNARVLGLLDEWIEKVYENLNIWEQKVLEQIVYARQDLNIYKLPASYCCVLMQDYTIPAYIKEPVIVHHQASRKYRNFKRR